MISLVFWCYTCAHRLKQQSTSSPLHPEASSRVKPAGQVQLSPTFTMPDGQAQPVLFSNMTWCPGHLGAKVELGEPVVVNGGTNAEGNKMGEILWGKLGRKSKEIVQKKRRKKNTHMWQV